MKPNKNECPGGAGQIVKKLLKRVTDFIVACTAAASFDVVFAVWILQFAAVVWGVL